MRKEPGDLVLRMLSPGFGLSPVTVSSEKAKINRGHLNSETLLLANRSIIRRAQ